MYLYIPKREATSTYYFVRRPPVRYDSLLAETLSLPGVMKEAFFNRYLNIKE